MTLITLAAIWALAYGHITLTQDVRFKGREARIFGILAIAMAAYGMPHLHNLVDQFAGKYVNGNEVFKTSYDLLLGAFAAYVTAWVTTQVAPRLKVPRLKGFKKARA